MRKHWILSCVLSASALGCAGTGMPGGSGQFAGQPQAAQLAAMQNGGTPGQQTSWTQKVTGVFTGKNNQMIGPSKPDGNTELDPIALGFASGPPNAELYFSMAKMSDQGGNAAHARSMYQRALTVQPNHLDGMLALARLEDREGELDAALHYYKQAVQSHPTSAKALNDLSLCFARRAQVAEALPPLEQAIRLEPSKQLYRNNIAKVLIEMNQINGAVQHLAAVHPPAVAQYNMGVLLHERGRDQEAVGFLTAATQLDPSLTPASTLLAQLTSGGPQFAQNTAGTVNQVANSQQVANNEATTSQVLPTAGTSPYPTTAVNSASPVYQNVPAETARVPVGYAPTMMPPVR